MREILESLGREIIQPLLKIFDPAGPAPTFGGRLAGPLMNDADPWLRATCGMAAKAADPRWSRRCSG